MIFNRNYIIILSLLGIILLYSYYYFLKDNNNANKLWGSIKGNLLKIYYLSMILSVIGFLLLFYYLMTSNSFSSKDISNIFLYTSLIVAISILWTPSSLQYYYTKKNIYKYITLLILFLVALSTFMLLISLNNVNDKKLSKNLALIGMSYFFIHTFLFDFLLWSYNFF